MGCLTQLVLEHVAADAAGVWLLERRDTSVMLYGDVGLSHGSMVAHMPHPPTREILGWIVDRPAPFVLQPLPGSALAPARPWLEREAFRSMLAVPLVGETSALGALALFRRGHRAFTRHDLGRAEALCVPAAPAVLNARLYAAQLGRAERTEALLATAQALGATLDLPTALADLSRHATRALDVERCTITLWPDGTVPVDAPVGDVEAARTARPVEVNDTLLVVPIARKGEVIGVMRLIAPARGRWERSAVDLASAMAGQIALVADNARLYREAQTQTNELVVLREVGTMLTSTLNLPTVLDAVAEAAMRLSGGHQCAVLELEPGEQRLFVRAQRGLADGWQRMSLALGQGAAGVAAQSRAPFFVEDLEREQLPGEQDPVGDPPVPLRWVMQRDSRRAALSVPLVGEGAVLGAITVFWREPHQHDEREVRLLTSLAQQAAVAVAQARLHGASLRRAEELAALLRAVRAMLGGLDTKTILETIVAEAAAIAGTPHVSLLLLDPETRTLRLAAVAGSAVPLDAALPLTERYSDQVAATGAPVFVPDTRADPRTRLAPRDRDAGILTYLGLPVSSRDTVLGVLTFSTTTPRRYAAEELASLGSFADHAAIALDNGRLYDDAQRALRDLRAMQRRLVHGETLRALGELAGGAAHHLNNLLTVVVGRIQLMRRGLQDESLARPLEIVERAARDGAEVVRRLQQFAGMRRVVEPRTVDLSDLARDVLELTRGRWQDASRGHGREIVVESRLTPLPQIPGDPAGLREMLTNLVLNAIDALPDGGRLGVETRLVDGAAVIAVSDTGLGMPEEVRARAHEPFFTTKGVKATGLGLSVAFGVARRHGGDLAIESGVGRGTTVRVTLPLPPAPTPATPPRRHRPAHPPRILLVDDEEEVCQAVAELLASRGHAVATATSGADALRKLEQDAAFDLVVTDLAMPAMTGWELAEAVKARHPGLRVGVMSGWGEVPEAAAATRTIVDFVLSKPLTLEALDDAVGLADRSSGAED